MAMYPSRFSSDPTLGPQTKNKSKRGVGQMACKTKKTSTAKKTTTKKSSCKKKPC